MIVFLLSAWLDELIKERLATEISEFGSFEHGEGFDDSSPPRTHVKAKSGPTSSHAMQPMTFPRPNSIQTMPKMTWHDMACHGTKDVPDTPIRHPTVIVDEEVVVSNHFPMRYMLVAPSDRSGKRRRMRQMAPNLLSPFIAQPQTRQSALKMDLKQAAAIVFDGDLDPRMLQFDNVSRTKLFLSPYIFEMVMHSNAKHLMHNAVIAHFEPYLYPLVVSYQNANEAKVVLWLVAYKKEMVDVDFKMFRFVMPDVPCQPNEAKLRSID
ncbi:hypothetical protein CK203_027740 [Vitis vinifera]|uniref:Uncharacterized protein n=1 Tax=Vitis vinifera TaxID=29760 RepID=A0A438IH42_VITVI|nr:hypothetical protein CK203_027740 [Vitis vinifera]